MKGSNIALSIMLLFTLFSCKEILNFSKNKNLPSSGILKSSPEKPFLPTDLKSVTIKATQDNGEGFIISSVVAQSKGKPQVEDGNISFNVNYETFSGSKDQLALKTEIFSLVKNGFINSSFSTENFSLNMEPGIYILTVTLKKGTLSFPPFKAKMVVKCDSTLQGNIFAVDPSRIQISPASYTFWPEKNRNVYLGNYTHNLEDSVSAPAGGNKSLYTYNIDSNGDGTLEIIDGTKVARTGYGIDIINRNLGSSTIAYSSFADDQRFLTYEIYDECYNDEVIEVSTGNSGIFDITEKEDLTSPSQRPQMSTVPLAPEDPSYMVYAKLPFLQQIQEQKNAKVPCSDRSSGGVNYLEGCDTRLTGTLSIIPAAKESRSTVGCQVSNGSLSIKAEELDLPLTEGQNYNIIGNYGVNMTINGIKTITGSDGFPSLDPNGAILNNYTYTIPGAGDAIGKDVLTTNNCSIEVLFPLVSKTKFACGGDLTGDIEQTIQHVRVTYQCNSVTSTHGKFMQVAGELYCTNGLLSQKSNCKNNNPPPTGTTPPPGTPTPTFPPPPPTPVAE